MTWSDTQLRELLKQYFGFSQFRSPQDKIVHSILSGQDTFVLLPTGAGKSLCYQFPAAVLPGLTLVFSPLIALMKDQVDHLTAHGIPAGCINSTMTRQELRYTARQVIRGQLKLLYLAPERLTVLSFVSWLQRQTISLIAIDEAHCISEWGHDFRPDYLQLASLRTLFPSIPIIALTASAVPQSRRDIVNLLRLKDIQVFQTTFNRPNLHYVIRSTEARWEEVLYWLRRYQGKSVVVYCVARKTTELVAADLQQLGFLAQAYHAGLPKEKRAQIQEEFARDVIKVVVATIAFGMGIDKPNIRLVIHYDLPKSLEGYYQETGRAGRDGLKSFCVLFMEKASDSVHQRFIAKMTDKHAQKIAQQKLQRMLKFTQANTCRRRMLLDYFAEHFPLRNCQSCDVCVPEYRKLHHQLKEKEAVYSGAVFEQLRVLRKEIALAEEVPAFVVFSDHSLREMATYLPSTLEEFTKISGVGNFKLKKYGKQFITLIITLTNEYLLQSTPVPSALRTQKLSTLQLQKG